MFKLTFDDITVGPWAQCDSDSPARADDSPSDSDDSEADSDAAPGSDISKLAGRGFVCRCISCIYRLYIQDPVYRGYIYRVIQHIDYDGN